MFILGNLTGIAEAIFSNHISQSYSDDGQSFQIAWSFRIAMAATVFEFVTVVLVIIQFCRLKNDVMFLERFHDTFDRRVSRTSWDNITNYEVRPGGSSSGYNEFN